MRDIVMAAVGIGMLALPIGPPQAVRAAKDMCVDGRRVTSASLDSLVRESLASRASDEEALSYSVIASPGLEIKVVLVTRDRGRDVGESLLIVRDCMYSGGFHDIGFNLSVDSAAFSVWNHALHQSGYRNKSAMGNEEVRALATLFAIFSTGRIGWTPGEKDDVLIEVNRGTAFTLTKSFDLNEKGPWRDGWLFEVAVPQLRTPALTLHVLASGQVMRKE